MPMESETTSKWMGTVPDSELQASLSEKLTYDRIGYGVMFNALNLQVQSGVVTVGGDVRDYPSRDSALAIVETTPGVNDVIDEINVLPTSIFDDELRVRIARAIYGQAALQRYALFPEKPIRIIVDNGHVTLHGVVDNTMDRQISETQAKVCAGCVQRRQSTHRGNSKLAIDCLPLDASE